MGHCIIAGSGVIYFVDAGQVDINTAHGAHTGSAISVGPLRVNVLAAGEQYDLPSRKLVFAEGIAHTV